MKILLDECVEYRLRLDPKSTIRVEGLRGRFSAACFREPVAGKAVTALRAFGDATGRLGSNEQFVKTIIRENLMQRDLSLKKAGRPMKHAF